MLIVCAGQARVEAELVAGALSCPSCRGVLGPWGHGPGAGTAVFGGGSVVARAVSRVRGHACVLLPDVVLLRRQDEVSVIGAAIEAKVLSDTLGGDREGVQRHARW